MNTSNFTKPLALALLSLSVASTAMAEPWSGHAYGTLGQKSLSGNTMVNGIDWSELDDQGSIGIGGDIKHESWPVSITLASYVSGSIEKQAGDNKQEMGTFELQLGVQKYFTIEGSYFKPYLGLGVAYVSAEMTNTVDGVKTKDDDTKASLWAGAGVIYDINEHFDVGLDIRYSDADLTIFDTEHGAGGLNTSIRVGYHF